MKKNLMKVLAIVICLMMAIPAASLFVGAEEPAKWEGDVAESFAGGKGTESDPFQITKGDHLALLSAAINYGVDGEYVDLGGMYFKVMNDIDMNGLPFEPIGGELDSVYFSGYFDGNGKTISNLNLISEYGIYFQSVGLFGCVSNAVVRNVNLENLFVTEGVTAKCYFNAGALVGKAINSKIINCHVKSDLVLQCHEGDSQTTIYAGGVIGFMQDGGVVKGVTYDGTLTVNGRGDGENGKRVATVFGGIIGRLDWDAGTDDKQFFIEDCIVNGKLQNVSSSYHIFMGGLTGIGFNGWGASDSVQKETPMVWIKNCLVTADLDVSKVTMDNTPEANKYINWGGITSQHGSYITDMNNVHFFGTAIGEDNTCFAKPNTDTLFSGIIESSRSLNTYANVTTSWKNVTINAVEYNTSDDPTSGVKNEENWKGKWDRATCAVETTAQKDLAKATIEANIAALADYDDEYDPDMFDILNPWYDGPMTDDPVDTDPVDTDPVDTDPVDTDPVDTDPVDTDPVDTDPVDTDPVDTDPVDTDPVDTDPDDKPAEGGCGGSITMAGIAMVAALGAAAVVITKKKED